MERDEFKRKNYEFDRQREALLKKATGEAIAERQRLFDAARKDSDSLRAKQLDMLHSEYQSLNEEIARRTRTEVFAIASVLRIRFRQAKADFPLVLLAPA